MLNRIVITLFLIFIFTLITIQNENQTYLTLHSSDNYAILNINAPFRDTEICAYALSDESFHTTTNENSTIYHTITVSTTITLLQTTSPLPNQGPQLVIYDTELFFEEDDIIKIETSSGARLYINPSLEEIVRRDWTRIYKVINSGNYKIRATTGHGSARLFVNIYKITTTIYLEDIINNSTTLTTFSNYTRSTHTTNNDSKTNLTTIMDNDPTSERKNPNQTIPGYSIGNIIYGITIGTTILLIRRFSHPQQKYVKCFKNM